MYYSFTSSTCKRSVQVQDRSMHFNVIKYGKFTDKISDSTLQLTLRNYDLLMKMF